MQKIRRKNIKSTVALIIVMLYTTNVGIQAFTVDDVRDIVGAARVDERFTDIEMTEIELRYREVEKYNQYARIFDLSKELKVDTEVEKEYKELGDKLKRVEVELEERYKVGGGVNEILALKSEIEVIKYEIASLKEIGYEMSLEYVENEWESDYIEIQETLETIKNNFEVGHIGLGLRSPVYSGMMLKSIYGFRINQDTGDSLEFHGGIDIETNEGEPILGLWNGVVTNIYKVNGRGETVEITHGEGLKTRYAHLGGVKVKLGQEVRQYAEIGVAGLVLGETPESYLHFEIELDNEVINPLYVFGQEGINAAKVYISKNPDRNREIHDIEREVINTPRKESPSVEEEEMRYPKGEKEIDGEIKGKPMYEKVEPLKPWEIRYIEEIREEEEKEKVEEGVRDGD